MADNRTNLCQTILFVCREPQITTKQRAGYHEFPGNPIFPASFPPITTKRNTFHQYRMKHAHERTGLVYPHRYGTIFMSGSSALCPPSSESRSSLAVS